jgi:hypothetical protein
MPGRASSSPRFLPAGGGSCINALEMIMHRHGQRLLGVVLADAMPVQVRLISLGLGTLNLGALPSWFSAESSLSSTLLHKVMQLSQI